MLAINPRPNRQFIISLQSNIIDRGPKVTKVSNVSRDLSSRLVNDSQLSTIGANLPAKYIISSAIVDRHHRSSLNILTEISLSRKSLPRVKGDSCR